jgi:hypothetical protein
MMPTRPIRAALLAAFVGIAAVALLVPVDAASVTTFTTSDRVEVLATGELATVDHVLGDRVVVFTDASGAQLRAYPSAAIEPYVPPEPPPTTTPTTPPPPTTTTTTTPPGSAAGWNGFGIGSWPPASWRPYADSSPFNQQLFSDATPHPASVTMISRILSWGSPGNLFAGGAGTSSDYGHPTYWAQPGDPVYTLKATGYSPDVNGLKIAIPSAAKAAGGGDQHMTVVEPDGWEYDFWEVASKPAGGGTMTFELGGRTRVDGDGRGSNATAARFGNLAGVIRAQELIAGHIDHALFIVLKCTSSATTFGYGTKTDGSSKSAFVYPALAGGARCSSADNADAPPMGARFQLNMTDAQINALAVPTWKKTILKALAHYGGYVGDTGGPGFGLQFESGSTYTSFGAVDPLVTYAKGVGLSTYNGMYVFNLAAGVDWAKYLRILPPPTQ